MNHRTATIAATIACLAFTSCSAQQRRMYDNITRDEPAVEVVAPTLPGDPPIQGPCEAGEVVVDGTCLPHDTDTPPSTQPPEDPNAPLSCPPGEVVDPDPTPHCVLG